MTELATILGAVGTIMLGFYAYQRNIQKNFLDHLEKKNGHLERIANAFSDTVKEISTELGRVNEQHANIASVLERATRALDEHHKHA